MLTKKQIDDVCLVGHDSKTCRYLGENNNNYYCLKKTLKKQIIDQEVKDYFTFCEKSKIDPDKLCLPTADNCEGFHSF